MERGQAEVRLRFPGQVTGGAFDAAERARFRELVLGELKRALRASGAH
jgi:hypothetical protein